MLSLDLAFMKSVPMICNPLPVHLRPAASYHHHAWPAQAWFYMKLASLTGMLTLATVPSQACAQSIELGHQLAAKLCSNCHVVDSMSSGVVSADIPSFSVIARKPNQSATAIAGALIMSHPPMPDISLTRNEIANIATYIMSLK